MTATTSTPGIPGPRQPEAAPTDRAAPQDEAALRDDAAAPNPEAVFAGAMARFAQMYDEWRTAVRAIRDA
jgi:hypothetical protein